LLSLDHTLHSFKVSIVIPTYNRKLLLNNLLLSIEKSNYKPFEIIVIDQSNDDTYEYIKNNFPYVKIYKYKLKLGAYLARYFGAEYAKGDLIAYLDDDIIVTKNWLSNIVTLFERNNIGAVCSTIINPNKIYPPVKEDKLFRYLEANPNEDQCEVEFGSEAGLVYRRSLLSEKMLDRKILGAGQVWGENIVICKTIKKANYKIFYSPKAILYHFPQSSGTSLNFSMSKIFYEFRNATYLAAKYQNESILLIIPMIVHQCLFAFRETINRKNPLIFYYSLKGIIYGFSLIFK
jgi:glycosyltransferase involved in cell wall biosynthesis